MKASARVLAAVWSITFAALAFAPTVTADPFGIDYEVTLDGTLSPGIREGHFGVVTFDGITELIPNDIVPPPPSFSPGNDLIVMEDRVVNPDETETIKIWLEGQVTGQPFPTPGAPLFVNPLDTSTPVLFEVNGLHWGSFTVGGFALAPDFRLTFAIGGTEVPIVTLFEDATGSGTVDDPLFLSAQLNPNDFVMDGDRATDLHLEFDVVHIGNGPPPNGNGPNGIIPEPTTLLLLGTGLVGLAGLERRKRNGQKEGE